MNGNAFRINMGNLISVPAQSALPLYTITHAHSFMFCEHMPPKDRVRNNDAIKNINTSGIYSTLVCSALDWAFLFGP